jgi:hypothetical protein
VVPEPASSCLSIPIFLASGLGNTWAELKIGDEAGLPSKDIGIFPCPRQAMA